MSQSTFNRPTPHSTTTAKSHRHTHATPLHTLPRMELPVVQLTTSEFQQNEIKMKKEAEKNPAGNTNAKKDSETVTKHRIQRQMTLSGNGFKANPKDYNHISLRLLQYVIKSSQHDMREAEYTHKLKQATKNVFIMITLTAAFFGLTNGWRFVDSLWFAFVTLSTIGYGDFTPETPFSRAAFVIFSKVGLGTMTLFLAEVIDYANRQRENERRAMERVKKAEAAGISDPNISSLNKKICCGLLPPAKTTIQKSGLRAFTALLSFSIMMFLGAIMLNWSEGWWFSDGLYFAFQTSSTIGYGDQSSFYRHWSSVAHRADEVDESQLWSEITLGYNASLGQVPPEACLAGKGRCSLSADGTECSCTFSDIAKLTLTIYFLMSVGSLAVLFDASMAYTEALYEEQKRLATKLKEHASSGVRKMSSRLSSKSANELTEAVKEDLESRAKDTDGSTTTEGSSTITTTINGDTKGSNDTKVTPIDASEHRHPETSVSMAAKAKCYQTPCFRLSGITAAVVLYMFFGSLVFHHMEPGTFPTYWESYYFAAISLTTIGYGDFCVSTWQAKIVLIFYGVLGIALVSKFLANVQTEMSASTHGRVDCAKKLVCCKESTEAWPDQVWLVILVTFQALVMYALGLTLFLAFECAWGQQGNMFIEGDENGTSWLNFDILLFYNSVTTTTIGYGANFYPRTFEGRIYLIIFSWVALANTFFLIDAITGYVKARAQMRWEVRQKDLMLTTGLAELEGLLVGTGLNDLLADDDCMHSSPFCFE